MKVPTNAIQRDDNLYVKIDKQTLPINIITNKDVYWKIVREIQIPHVTKDKWEKELSTESNSWPYYFQNALIIRDTKIRSFQYKILMNLIPCNLYLYKIGRLNNYNCNYCPNVDNMTHYFYSCNGTKLFWNSFQSWWNRMKLGNIEIDKTMAIFGINTKNEKHNKLKACLQIARWHIYTEKLNIHEPSLYKFWCHLRQKIKIEKIISLRNNTTSKFNKLWGEIEELIE